MSAPSRPANGPNPPASPRATGAGLRRSLATLWAFLRRWHRFAIPVALVLAVTVFTLVCHSLQSDDVTDPAFLNPASQAPTGAYKLADQLRGHGVSISTGYGANDLLTKAESGNVTLFIPEPSLLNSHQQDFLNSLPPSDTIVLVAPDDGALSSIGVPVKDVHARWSTRVAPPDCSSPIAAAGPAGVDGLEYTGVSNACYHGAVVSTQNSEPQFWLVGASDVFRNNRIDEAGNQALAVALLDTRTRLLWIDIHHPEAPPRIVHTNSTQPPTEDPAVIYVRDDQNGSTDYGNGNGSGGGDSGNGGSEGSSGSGGSGNNNSSSGGGSGGSSSAMAQLFPGWMWTAIGLIVLAAIAMALAAARRLGPPVTEPMPVTARLRESVEGRGRLYRRARQPAAALDVMRRNAINALPDQLGMPASTPVARLLELTAERTGWPPEVIDGVLRDDRPDDDAHLLALVRRLDQLMAALNQSTRPTDETDLT